MAILSEYVIPCCLLLWVISVEKFEEERLRLTESSIKDGYYFIYNLILYFFFLIFKKAFSRFGYFNKYDKDIV